MPPQRKDEHTARAATGRSRMITSTAGSIYFCDEISTITIGKVDNRIVVTSAVIGGITAAIVFGTTMRDKAYHHEK